MSQEEKDRILGQTIREHRDATEQLERLRADAGRRGTRLKELGHHLAAYPEYLVCEGQPVELEFSKAAQARLWNPADALAPENIQQLTAAIRAETVRVRGLTESLLRMGHKF